MSDYFIGIGSNIDPERNVVRGIQALLSIAPEIHLSRIVMTDPVNVQTHAHFYNFAVAFSSDLDASALKAEFNRIERELGRDRDDPDSKIKSRTLDLDILFHIETGSILDELLPDEPYLRPQVLELMGYLNLPCSEGIPTLPMGREVVLEHLSLGARAMTIRRAADGGVIAMPST